jgi:hypothetical protein
MRRALNRFTLNLLKVLVCRPHSLKVHAFHSLSLFVNANSDGEIFPVSRFAVLDMNAKAIMAATVVSFRLV